MAGFFIMDVWRTCRQTELGEVCIMLGTVFIAVAAADIDNSAVLNVFAASLDGATVINATPLPTSFKLARQLLHPHPFIRLCQPLVFQYDYSSQWEKIIGGVNVDFLQWFDVSADILTMVYWDFMLCAMPIMPRRPQNWCNCNFKMFAQNWYRNIWHFCLLIVSVLKLSIWSHKPILILD